MASRVLIIDGHPDARPERFTHALAAAYREGAEAAGHAASRLRVQPCRPKRAARETACRQDGPHRGHHGHAGLFARCMARTHAGVRAQGGIGLGHFPPDELAQLRDQEPGVERFLDDVRVPAERQLRRIVASGHQNDGNACVPQT